MQIITKVYDGYAQAHGAVDELLTAGIPMSNISVLGSRTDPDQFFTNAEEGSEAGAGAGVGAVLGGAAGLLAGLGLMAIPGLGPVVAAGWLASTALGAAAGGATGGIVGSLISSGVSEGDANVYSEVVRRGGMLVSVQAEDHDVAKVQAILGAHLPINADEQRAVFRDSGWDEFDPHAPPYESTRAAAQRDQRLLKSKSLI